MNDRRGKQGFTLVELLVALALIATILSMVYGSYFATSRSAEVYRSGIAMCHQGRTALDQMARQIRCAYVGQIVSDTSSSQSDKRQTIEVQEDGISYFNGNTHAPDGEIMHFVTTNGFFEEKEKTTNGLFETVYRFDRRTGGLALSQRRFTGTIKRAEMANWRPIAQNVEHVGLEFFDGRRWFRSWDYKDKKTLPSAVRLEIGYRDEDNRRYDCGTVVYLACSNHQAGARTETLASVNKP